MKQVPLTVLACLLAALACGCAEKEMGNSVRLTMDSQKINPEPAPAEPVEGLDGQKAAGIVDYYTTTNETAKRTPQRTSRPASNVNLFMQDKK